MKSGHGTYTGETSRSVQERVKEHLEQAKSMETESHIAKHWFLKHQELEEPPEFRFRLVGQ